MKYIKFTNIKFVIIITLFIMFILTNFYKESIIRKFQNVLTKYEFKEILFPEYLSGYRFIDNPNKMTINKRKLAYTNKNLKFLLAGHIIGNPNFYGYKNAISFRKNIKYFNEMNLDFIILLGDIISEPTKEYINALKNDILSKLSIPVFNAVGNHDIGQYNTNINGRSNYENNFGPTVFSFIYKNNLFIFFDTNIKYYDLSKYQIKFAKRIIHENINKINNINIFMHFVLFFNEPGSSRNKWVVNNGISSNNFFDFINEYINNVSKKIPVNIFAGDHGIDGKFNPYYKYDSKNNVRYFATGLGDTFNDNVLLIEENNNKLKITPIFIGKDKIVVKENYFER